MLDNVSQVSYIVNHEVMEIPEMSSPKQKSEMLHTRVTPEMKESFVEQAEPFGGASDLLRELVAGFIEGRVTIAPPQHLKELYDVPGIQD